MSHPIYIILANAPLNSGNRGCIALSYTSIYLIDKVMKCAGRKYKLYLTNGDFGNDQEKLSINIMGKNFPYTVLGYPLFLSKKEFAKEMVKPNLAKFRFSSFRNADYILDIGQGDSFSDFYGKDRFNMINLIHRHAAFFHKPYCILPQTIGPFETPTIKAKAAKAIANANMVMARDKLSYQYVINNVPSQKNIKEYIDVAFFLPYKKKELDHQYINVGLNISALLWHGGYTGNNQFSIKDDYHKIIRSIIDFFLGQENVRIFLVPHVVGEYDRIENDYVVSYNLVEEYDNPRLNLSPFFITPIDAKNFIAGLDFFMGARMHATIAAFSSGVPVVPMAYSRKFNGLFIDTLNYNHLVDLKVDEEEDAITKIKNDFEHRNMLRKEIKFQNETTVVGRKKLLIEDLKAFFHIS